MYRKFSLILTLFCLPGLLSAQQYLVEPLLVNGPDERRINVVILGDGYQAIEQASFFTHAEDFLQSFSQEVPFFHYMDYFNFYAIFTPSNVSGAAMNPQNLIDNYYGSTFWYLGIERLLYPTNQAKITEVLATHFPNYDQVLMLVNSTKYGGSGGQIATSSVHKDASEIMLHEIGHSFAFLADEYWAGDQFAAELENLTQESDPQNVRWKKWYGDFGVGVYQHCCGETSSEWYKPHQQCKMEFLGYAFCVVCNQAFIQRIHSLTNPIESFFPTTQYLQANIDSILFTADLLKPDPNTLKTVWTLNDDTLKEHSTEHHLVVNDLSDDIHTLKLIVVDTTEQIRIGAHHVEQIYYVEWEIYNLPVGMPALQGRMNELIKSVYPNPASDKVNVRFFNHSQRGIEIRLYDIKGTELYNSKVSDSEEQILLEPFDGQQFVLVFYKDGKRLHSKKIIRVQH